MTELKKLNKKAGAETPASKVILVGFSDWEAFRLGMYLTCGSLTIFLLVLPAIAFLVWMVFIILEVILF